MSSSTVFTKSVLKTKKQSKTKLFFRVLKRVILNNQKLFFFCVVLSVFTAIINYNISANLREFLSGGGEQSVLEKSDFSFNFNLFG